MERRLSDPEFAKAMKYVQNADFFPANARSPRSSGGLVTALRSGA
jgi:hypothetical protein